MHTDEFARLPHMFGTPGDTTPADIDLDAAPPRTRREMLQEAYRRLDIINRYGLRCMTDKQDRQHLIEAHRLLAQALVE